MLNIMGMLSARLGDDKLKPHETRRLIKDVSNIIGREAYFEPSNLKPALKMLGWEEDILDYRTLELICILLENRMRTKRVDKTWQSTSDHSGSYISPGKLI